MVPAQSKSRRLAANACWAACVRMADQRERREASTALRRMLGTALAFVWAKRRRKVVASGLHRPPVSRARTTSLHLLERRSSESGYVRSLDLRASWRVAAALSNGIPRPRKTPAWAHAARWSPSGSRVRRHRQMRADRGNGRRRRRRSRTRKR